LFTLHNLAFTILGGSEFSARIFTALGGVGLVLLPVLFRRWLGGTRTLVFSLLLTFSPILLAASRTDSPVIWTMLAAGLGLWGLLSYRDTGQGSYAVTATVCAVSVILLTDPTGPILALSLVGAGVFAFWIKPAPVLEDAEAETEDRPPSVWGARWRAWPWPTALLLSVLAVVVVSTMLLAYPQGFSAISQLLNTGVRGITTARPGAPTFFPLVTVLFYEPVLIIFGLVAVWRISRQETASLPERFLMGWLVFGIVASLVYAGAGPEQALWLVIPLAGLAAFVVNDLFVTAQHPIWGEIPWWSRWLLALAVVGLLAMLGIHAQAVGRSLLTLPDEYVADLGRVVTQMAEISSRLSSANAVWIIIIPLFLIITFFLAGSIWGLEASTKGMALGLLIFGLVTSVSRGWHITTTNADNPAELWNRQSVSGQLMLLRRTLLELTDVRSGGFPVLSVAVLAPEDGAVAWQVRDFVNNRFITDPRDAQGQGVVLLPMYSEDPKLDGSYVGQPFTVNRAWDMRMVRWVDFLAWWTQGRVRFEPIVAQQIVLWVRQDIYTGSQSQGR
jgi:hypothetical protein